MRSIKLDVPKAPGEKRYNAGLAYGACGACWRAGQQLAWLTAKIAPLEGHVEVNLLAEVSMLWGHVASGRPTWTLRSRISTASVLLLGLCCPFGNVQPKLAPGEPGREKKDRGRRRA